MVHLFFFVNPDRFMPTGAKIQGCDNLTDENRCFYHDESQQLRKRGFITGSCSIRWDVPCGGTPDSVPGHHICPGQYTTQKSINEAHKMPNTSLSPDVSKYIRLAIKIIETKDLNKYCDLQVEEREIVADVICEMVGSDNLQ